MPPPPSSSNPDDRGGAATLTWAESAIGTGITSILSYLEAARSVGHREALAMGALLSLRRSGTISFDGREIQRPPRPGASRPRRQPFDPSTSSGWFRYAR